MGAVLTPPTSLQQIGMTPYRMKPNLTLLAALLSFLLCFSASATRTSRAAPARNNPSEWGNQPRQHNPSQETHEMNKKQAAARIQSMVEDTQRCVNELADDAEPELTEEEARTLLGRQLARSHVRLVAAACGAEEDDVRAVLAPPAAEETETPPAEAATS